MSEITSMGRAFDWEDEIENDGASFQILPEGDYAFRVKKFERARHGGSDKIPPCNKAVLTLEVSNGKDAGEVQSSLFLHEKFEWKLCQFFTCISQRKHGEKLRMNWNAVPGSCGTCHITTRTWTGNDGKTHEGNEIAEFFDPKDHPMPAQGMLELPDSAAATPWDKGGMPW